MYSDIYLKDYTKEQFLRTKRSYYANITLIDEKVGEVIDILKSTMLMTIRLLFTALIMVISWVIMD